MLIFYFKNEPNSLKGYFLFILPGNDHDWKLIN